jgi:sterol desaturase/sphingolipid hydroxylase (fatty acid hydroxylase superfamily)
VKLETLQLVSPVIIVATAVAFILLERWKPYNEGQTVFRDGFWVDLIGYGLVQSYFMGLLISFLIHWIDGQTKLSRLNLVSDWPVWGQVLFFIIFHDFNTYWMHRLQHNSDVMWRTHEAHHSAPAVDWLSGIRSHSLEILLYETVHFLPIILLGAAPEVALWKGIFNSTYGMYIHSNLDVRMGKLLWVLNGPELHRWHHANDDEKAYGKNLGTKFSFWDHCFGTYYAPTTKAHDYGPPDPNFPKGYLAQHLFAFRRLVKGTQVA